MDNTDWFTEQKLSYFPRTQQKKKKNNNNNNTDFFFFFLLILLCSYVNHWFKSPQFNVAEKKRRQWATEAQYLCFNDSGYCFKICCCSFQFTNFSEKKFCLKNAEMLYSLFFFFSAAVDVKFNRWIKKKKKKKKTKITNR